MSKKKILITLTLLIIATCLTIYYCNKLIVDIASEKLYSETASIPYNKVGLLLGTSKYIGDGYVNAYYSYRIDATIKLVKDAKIKYVIISGDNGKKDYNEPEMMRADLIKAGMDSSRIYLDYAGFRTFDSMVRLKEIFGQQSVAIISQQFHNERAIYIASKLGINAVGFNAKDVLIAYGFKTQLREKFARVKVILDFLFGKKPRFLGEKILIPA